MDKPESARSVVPRPSNQKILRRLRAASKIKLGRTDRDTIFVFETAKARNREGWFEKKFPIAIAPRIVSRYAADRASQLEDVLVLGTPNTSMDVSIIIPNTTRHTYLANHIEDHLANFGAMDDCVYPDCKLCRRAAQCLTGGICHSVVATGRFTKVKAGFHEESLFRAGDRFNVWTFALGRHVAMRSIPREGPRVNNFDIWLHRRGDDYELEFVRSEP